MDVAPVSGHIRSGEKESVNTGRYTKEGKRKGEITYWLLDQRLKGKGRTFSRFFDSRTVQRFASQEKLTDKSHPQWLLHAVGGMRPIRTGCLGASLEQH